jgi:pimeloyl-ACP methyl ester carboxylesterase
MQGVDNTILNVALPHIQGSLSASLDQVAWALTSYIVCAAIMMPLTGWLQPSPFPETMVQNSAEYFLKWTLLWLGGNKLTDPLPDWISPAVFQEYLRTFRQPDRSRAIYEDYRAAASIDLAHDKADLDKKIQCPLLVLWSEKRPVPSHVQRSADVARSRRPGGGQGHADGPFHFANGHSQAVRADRMKLRSGGRDQGGQPA